MLPGLAHDPSHPVKRVAFNAALAVSGMLDRKGLGCGTGGLVNQLSRLVPGVTGVQ